MSQADIIDFLKKEPSNWFYAHEIWFFTNLPRNMCMLQLKILMKHDEVYFKKALTDKTSGRRNVFMYKYKKEEDDII